MTDRALSATPADLDRIHVRFATYRERSAAERARFGRLLETADATERVLLDTCHRVELVTVAEDIHPPGAALSGRAAVARVFEVVGGFDSAVVAEEQLLGQARGAYETALAEGTTGPILNELFRRALRYGRRVRSQARPGSERSLADRGAAWLLQRLPEPVASVIVAGTGEMGRVIATHLAARGHRITVVSASADRGGRLVEQLGDGHRLHVGPITELRLGAADAIALAVRSRGMALTGGQLGGHRPLVLDLSSPGAVDEPATVQLGDRLLTIDELARIEGATPVLDAAVERGLRIELEAEVERFVGWLDARQHADAIAVLRGEADAVRRRHIDRLGRRSDLDAEQLAAVDAASAAMLNELLHGPSMELRRGGSDAATVRRLFGIGSR